jgi:hypothetical protein
MGRQVASNVRHSWFSSSHTANLLYVSTIDQ